MGAWLEDRGRTGAPRVGGVVIGLGRNINTPLRPCGCPRSPGPIDDFGLHQIAFASGRNVAHVWLRLDELDKAGEGVIWAHGWKTPEANALRALMAL